MHNNNILSVFHGIRMQVKTRLILEVLDIETKLYSRSAQRSLDTKVELFFIIGKSGLCSIVAYLSVFNINVPVQLLLGNNLMLVILLNECDN